MTFNDQLTLSGGRTPRKPIRDPVMAVAVARCYMADHLAYAHRETCRYCRVPNERKIAAVIEFNTWRDEEPRMEVEAFMALDPEEQRRLVEEHMYTIPGGS